MIDISSSEDPVVLNLLQNLKTYVIIGSIPLLIQMVPILFCYPVFIGFV